MSQTYATDLPGQAGFDTTVTVSGATSKPAGTYNVSLVCAESSLAVALGRAREPAGLGRRLGHGEEGARRRPSHPVVAG